VVDVVVLGQPSLSADFVVDKDGGINYPLIGRVEAAGLSPADLARKLQALLGAGFLKKPEVSVRVKEYRSRPVLVLGEVVRPGIYALKGDRSVLTTLSDAGGLTANAGHEFLVARPPEGSESVAIDQFSSMPLVPGLSDAVRMPDADALPPGAIKGSDVFRASFRELMKGNAEQNVILEGGDIVFVPRAAQIYVTGQAARPAAFKYVDGMTVQDALQLAGGISDRGSIKRLKIVRFEAGKRKEVKAELTDLLKPGDTLNVGERFF
jgi:polysaccharide export outer membrane protein